MLGEIVWNANTIAVVAPFAMIAVCSISYYWYRWNKVRSENDLKQSMVQRGMSVEEIERVMASGRASQRE